jgi:CelD/BcsL family acetyltransferase involved in cellulose biosynthesis
VETGFPARDAETEVAEGEKQHGACMTVRLSASETPVAALDGTVSAIASARRALLADRYPVDSLTVEWRSFTELASLVPAWRKLAETALEPNVFYEPAFALAAAPVFAADAGAMLVWSEGSPRRLLGFFPARVEKRRYGFNLPLLVGWTHPYAPLGVPLVEREAAEPVIAAWLAHLAAEAASAALVLLPYVTENGPFAAALEPILRRAQIPFTDFDRHQRALLAPSGERSLYVERALSRHRRKELRRQWRRLGETGAVALATAGDAAAVAAVIEHFFALEAAGWKGRAGTAAAGDDNLQRFVRKGVTGLAVEGKVTIDRLFVDGRAIAAAIVLRSGRSAWFWKIAYDEAFARFSPGVLLSVALTEELVEDARVVRADSCATADHPMIDHIWRERLPLCNRLIGVGRQAPFSIVRRLESLRSAAVAGAKSVRESLRQRGR